MKLILSQAELELAVRNYVNGMIQLQDGTDIAIEFKAGRGENGITAEIDINYLAVSGISEIRDAKAAGTPAASDAPFEGGTEAAAPEPATAPITPARAKAGKASKNIFADTKTPDDATPPAEEEQQSEQETEQAADAPGDAEAPPPEGGAKRSLFS